MLTILLVISVGINLGLIVKIRELTKKPKFKGYVKIISLSPTSVALVDEIGTTIDHIGFTHAWEKDWHKSKLHNKWVDKYNIEVVKEEELSPEQKPKAWIVDTSRLGVALIDEQGTVIDRKAVDIECEKEDVKGTLHRNWKALYAIQLDKPKSDKLKS